MDKCHRPFKASESFAQKNRGDSLRTLDALKCSVEMRADAE